jgi:hypothetical protein
MQTIARIQRDWRQMKQGHPGSGGFCFLSKHEIVIRKLMIMIATSDSSCDGFVLCSKSTSATVKIGNVP